MSNFYTYVYSKGNTVYVRGVENGIPFKRKEEYKPTMFVTSSKPSKWTTIHNEYVEPIQLDSISESRDLLERYKGVAGFQVYGMTNWERQFISDNYPGIIVPDTEQILVESIDIETTTEYGMTVQEMLNNPIEEIILITLMNSKTKKIVTFGIGEWDSNESGYVNCQNEAHLLREFLQFWQLNCPNIITGWNIEMFDIPYLVKRISIVLGEEYAKKLSPFGHIREKKFFMNDTEMTTYVLHGVSSIDYLAAYKKFTYITQESYKLDHIAFVELEERKKENPGKSFKDFYTNYWNTFVEYNRHDAVLVDMLEDKMKLIELIITISYLAKVNFEDVFSPVGTWDSIVYNYLRDQNIVVPNKERSSSGRIEGAYVKDPVVGFHEWVSSFDLNSLYPHLIMQYNMSPETLTSYQMEVNVDMLLDGRLSDDTKEFLEEHNLSMAANGWCYTKEKKGFLPALMETYYADRSKYKKEMLKREQEYQYDKSKDLEKEISRLNNLQMALKILLNSCYGALANEHFRYYDLRIAEGITLSGQLSLRWASNKLDEFLNKALKTQNVSYVIYNDTDSCYVALKDIVDKTCSGKSTEQIIQFMDRFCDEVLQPVINKGYDELYKYMNAYQQKMVMKRESLADKGIFIQKKRYILNVYNSEGVQYSEPKLKVMGLEMVRSSTPQVIRKVLKDSIKVILEGDQTKLRSFIEEFKKEYYNLSVEEIARPSGIRNIETYKGDHIYKKGTPMHVRGSLLYNYHLKRLGIKDYPIITDVDKIKTVYVKMPNPFREDVISFIDKIPPEFGLEKYIDYDTQFEKTFLSAIENIVVPIGWSIEEKATLDDFF